MKSVAILGHGFIGSRLLKYLNSFDNITAKCASNTDNSDDVDHVDYTNFNILADYLQGVDYVVNASGFTGVPNVDGCENEKEACWRLNVVSPEVSYAASVLHNARYIHISSGCIYDEYKASGDGWSENDTPNFGLYSNRSSFYSKTKHAAEIGLMSTATTLPANNPAILRIRIPFTKDDSPKNYFNKLLKYPNLIDYPNSMTCVEDLNTFIKNGIMNDLPGGIYNVVHSSPASASEVCSILESYGLSNPDWKFVSIEALKKSKHIKSNRSNCTLSTAKIRSYGMELPNITYALTQSISLLSKQVQWRSNELSEKSC